MYNVDNALKKAY